MTGVRRPPRRSNPGSISREERDDAVVGLARSFLNPPNERASEVRAAVGSSRARRDIWERLNARGIIPDSWIENDERRFSVEPWPRSPRPPRGTDSMPASPEAAITLASNVRGVELAEASAREWHRRAGAITGHGPLSGVVWRVLPRSSPLWRIENAADWRPMIWFVERSIHRTIFGPLPPDEHEPNWLPPDVPEELLAARGGRVEGRTMNAPVTCFMVTPSGRYRVKLRRYSRGDLRPCPAPNTYGHDAATPVGEEAMDASYAVVNGDDPVRFPHDDPRWPAACARCGAGLEPGDEWQVFRELVYLRADGSPGEYVLRDLPVGAMYDATWLRDVPDMCGPDGRSLHLRLPDGADWAVDCPVSGGGHWHRSGEPPRVTVRPSILTTRYHGWLTDGVLTPC